MADTDVHRSDINVQQCLYVAENARALREAAGITQAHLSRDTWISYNVISRCETKTATPSVSTLVRFIDAFRSHGAEIPAFEDSASLEDILKFIPALGKDMSLGKRIGLSRKTLENWRYSANVVPSIKCLASLEEAAHKAGVKIQHVVSDSSVSLVINED